MILSVVIPTHNRKQYLVEAIQSIREQTISDFEIIVVDDMSTDDTAQVIDRLKCFDDRIRYIRSKEKVGPGIARNIGVRDSGGEYIAFLDDDDIAAPERLKTQLEYLKHHADIGLLYTQCEMIDEHKRTLCVHPPISYELASECGKSLEDYYLNIHNAPKQTTLMVRKSAHMQIGGFPDLFLAEDIVYLLKAASLDLKISTLNSPLTSARRGSNREGLVSDIVRARKSVIHAIKVFRIWAQESGIKIPATTHKRALSNQMLEVAKSQKGLSGLLSNAYSILIDLSNEMPRSYLATKMGSKIRHVIGLK